jgi:hypothetical protein
MLEIQGATDLPRLKTVRSPLSPFVEAGYLFLIVTRTGWDMDPFVVISFGQKNLLHLHHPALPQPNLGRKFSFPRTRVRYVSNLLPVRIFADHNATL